MAINIFWRNLALCFILCAFISVICGSMAYAQTKPRQKEKVTRLKPKPSPSPSPKRTLKPRTTKKVVKSKGGPTHQVTQVEKVAQSLDIGLAGQKTTEKRNETSITIRNTLSWSEGGVLKFTPRLLLKLDLPNLQEKLRIKFTSYDESREESGINRSRVRTAPVRENYGASVALGKKVGVIETEFQPRVELHGSPQMAYIFKFATVFESNIFRLRPELELFARPDTGTGQFFALSPSYKFDEQRLLTLINEEQYTDGENMFSINHGLRYDHPLSDRTWLHHAFIIELNNRTAYHAERYVLSTSFEHHIIERFIHYDITPFLAFPKDANFHGAPGVVLNFDVIL